MEHGPELPRFFWGNRLVSQASGSFCRHTRCYGGSTAKWRLSRNVEKEVETLSLEGRIRPKRESWGLTEFGSRGFGQRFQSNFSSFCVRLRSQASSAPGPKEQTRQKSAHQSGSTARKFAWLLEGQVLRYRRYRDQSTTQTGWCWELQPGCKTVSSGQTLRCRALQSVAKASDPTVLSVASVQCTTGCPTESPVVPPHRVERPAGRDPAGLWLNENFNAKPFVQLDLPPFLGTKPAPDRTNSTFCSKFLYQQNSSEWLRTSSQTSSKFFGAN